jgi:hypothetical protein
MVNYGRPDGLRPWCKKSRKGRPTSGSSESQVAIPKTPAETLAEAISFGGKSFPKREISLAFGNVADQQLRLNHLCLSGDTQDESFPYQTSQRSCSQSGSSAPLNAGSRDKDASARRPCAAAGFSFSALRKYSAGIGRILIGRVRLTTAPRIA